MDSSDDDDDDDDPFNRFQETPSKSALQSALDAIDGGEGPDAEDEDEPLRGTRKRIPQKKTATKIRRVVVDYGVQKRYATIKPANVIWSAVVLDEAHKVRNFMSIHYQMASQLRCQAIFLITATPMWNQIGDIRPLCQLIATASGINSKTGDISWSAADGITGSKEPHKLFDPRDQQILSQLSTWEKTSRDISKRDPFFLLNWSMTSVLRQTDNVRANELLGKLLDMVQSRRLLTTTIKLPDGTTVMPSDSIPVFSVHTTFASHALEECKQELIASTNDFLSGRAVGAHQSNTATGSAGGVLDWGLYRQAAMAGVDLSTIALVRQASILAKFGTEGAWRWLDEQGLGAHHANALAGIKTPAIVGSGHLESIINQDADLGAGFKYQSTLPPVMWGLAHPGEGPHRAS